MIGSIELINWTVLIARNSTSFFCGGGGCGCPAAAIHRNVWKIARPAIKRFPLCHHERDNNVYVAIHLLGAAGTAGGMFAGR